MIRALARASVANPVAVNLATAAVALGGLFAYLGMPREVFPEFSMGTVAVTTVYPGAAPIDVERLVTLPLEEELEGIDGRREMTSSSIEGISVVTLTAERGTDMDRFVEDVRAAVSAGELPEAAEEPEVREVRSEFPAIAVFVYGNASDEELRRVAEDEKRALEAIPGVTRVILQGAREPRIWVEADPAALERFGLDLQTLGAVVAGRASESPLGALSTPSGDYLLRVDAEVREAAELREAPVLASPEGAVVRLKDVARVLDAKERLVTRARFNGKPCIYLQVNKGARGDAIAISRAVHERVARAAPTLGPGVALGTSSDLSVYIENRLRTMKSSAAIGGVLVLLSLVAFLSPRVALMTALGIPVAFLGGLLAAQAAGLSMNMMTMFALIVVLGMIVDDAIVVGENVYRHMELGLAPREAAVLGTAEVGRPVVATILTTIAAFLPTLLVAGTTGRFLRPLPLIVSFCLLASLLEALAVLPSHLAHWSGRTPVRAPAGARGRRRWYEPLRERYARLLRVLLRHRYATLAATASGIAVVVAVALWRLSFVLFDDFESKIFSVDVRTRPGSSIEVTDRVASEVERRIAGLPEEELASTNLVAGASYLDAARFTLGHDLAQVWVELREDEARRRSTAEIIADVRARLADPPPEAEAIDVVQPQAGPAGRAIDVAVRGGDLATLRVVADELEERLRGFRGVRDVRDDAGLGKREVRLRLTEAGRTLGLDEGLLARELRAAFEGTRFARVRRGRDDVEIVVKLPEELRAERGALARLRVPLPGAGPAAGGRARSVPLGTVAALEETTGLARISRDDGERAIRVTADVDKREGNAARIVAALRRKYAGVGERFPGTSLEFQGEARDTAESFEGIELALVLSLGAIYVILGSLFRSFAQPFVIMTAIPFGLVGMVAGHALLGRDLSFLSLVGLVALSGIVVNDSLILIEAVNVRRRAGDDLVTALVAAGERRFRPILLTSITTMVGLLPLSFFASGQARFLQPMAITVFFGLAASTSLILLVVPCAYAALEDLLLFARRPRTVGGYLRRGEPVPEALRPWRGEGGSLP